MVKQAPKLAYLDSSRFGLERHQELRNVFFFSFEILPKHRRSIYSSAAMSHQPIAQSIADGLDMRSEGGTVWWREGMFEGDGGWRLQGN